MRIQNRNPMLHAAAILTIVAGLMVGVPSVEAAAQDRVYAANEVTTPPAIKSPQAAATAIQRSLPPAFASMGGRVQLRFVVKPDGKVDPATIEIVAASANALGDAAKRAVERIEFTPGMVDGRPVSSLVMFPVVYSSGR
jgi:TonB family protein